MDRSDLLGIVLSDGSIGTYDLDQRAVARVSSSEGSEGFEQVVISADRTRVYLAYDRSQGSTQRSEVRAFDITDGTRPEPTFEFDGRVTSMSTTADGSRIAVTVDNHTTSVYDGRTARRSPRSHRVYGRQSRRRPLPGGRTPGRSPGSGDLVVRTYGLACGGQELLEAGHDAPA
ncbi:MAG TPA: hypothetical protein VJM49_14340 [Acidimicrobiales bacterium]|nr:hypothetical protein [Acidimicrobiales bacterium]